MWAQQHNEVRLQSKQPGCYQKLIPSHREVRLFRAGWANLSVYRL